MKKKILCSILALVCMLNIVVFADDPQTNIPTLSLQGTKTEQNTIELSVAISGNSWICGCSFNLIYDNSKLKYSQHTVEDLISNTANFVNDKYEENAIRVNWAGINELEQGGTVLKFTFDVLETASGNAEFKIDKLKMANAQGETIESTFSNVVVTISEEVKTPEGNTETDENDEITNGSSSGSSYDGGYSGSTNSGKGNSSNSDKQAEENIVDEEAPVEEPDYEVFLLSFNDVNETQWFYDSVKFVNYLGLMGGVSDKEFAPQSNLTRGMLVTILYRLSDEPECEEPEFSDVKEDAWYSKGIAWAAENGIVNGVGGGMFAPDTNITREQIAVIMYNFSKFSEIDVTGKAEILGYSDNSQISEWANDAMEWAVGYGLISGKGDNILDPKGNATRAEIATILSRYIKKQSGI